MRLPIFWRALLVQLALITLTALVSLYALAQLHRLTALSTDMLTTDPLRIEEEKKLLAIFVAQMRNAEKYVSLRDQVFADHFAQGTQDFDRMVTGLLTRVEVEQEKALLEHIRELHGHYEQALIAAPAHKKVWEKEKTAIAEGMTASINQLIDLHEQLHEQSLARKTATIHAHATEATEVVGWLTLGGVSVAVLLAYLHARGVSRPLKRLTQEMRYVGAGEFHRSVILKAPKEVHELAHSFNAMVSQLAKLDEMKADFIAHVSHDLRTPLTAIREGIALLLEEIPGTLAASQREVIEVMHTHSERLSHIIGSVLDLSKMEAGMMEYAQVPCDLMRLVDHSIATVGLIAQKKQITLSTACAAPLPFVSLDEEKVQQVLDNLLLNAVKFTPPAGMVQVSAALKEKAESHARHIEIRVTDTGSGIAAEELKRVFDKFYQSPAHAQTARRGSGLGLAITRHIVTAHGGTIWAESAVGKGATFCFTLPVEREARAAQSLTAALPGARNVAESRV